MPGDPFKARTSCRDILSKNPKTIKNRDAETAKYGIEIAEFHDQNAFRTAKYRALKKLRTSAGWITLGPDAQKEVEESIIADLEAKCEQKKSVHRLEWRRREEDDYSGPEEAGYQHVDVSTLTFSDEDTGQGAPEGSEEVNKDDEWQTCSEDEDDSEQISVLATEFTKIKQKSAKEWVEKLQWLSEHAKKREKEWQAYLSPSQ